MWSYENEKVAHLIKLSKFHSHFYYLSVIKKFKEFIDFSIFDGTEALVAVPMYKKDLQIRGYNQSVIIAKILSKISKVPVAYDLIEKVKQTKPQVGLKRQERLNNLKNVFVLNKKAKTLKKVLIVDDVVTTSSTINECAKLLLDVNIESNFFALAAET
ncbi:MAG: ComF family protein [Desulfurella sp.]|uniref:ComF family protein n=1 Tax=Desulfurella sp. TaxID=1962857 RepID=UPI003C95E6B4